MTELVWRFAVLSGLLSIFCSCLIADGQEPPVSELTQDCISCHSSATPAIVADWQRSRHSKTTPAESLKKPQLQRLISTDKVPEKLAGVVVGCAECHMANEAAHQDSFDHGGQKVHLLVSPKDCATCHPTESIQYEKNLMSHARGNLTNNQLYGDLMKSINGLQSLEALKTRLADPDKYTEAESCFHCHGTAVEVKGKKTRDTDFGEMEFLVLSGWPNQGVGRFNTDGSMGSCTPCHSRHQFSMELARKPYTCSQCHKGPDVPAYKAYSVSKHAAIFSSLYHEWNFKEVPWTLGTHITAPTCAVCHASLLTNSDGTVVAERTHQMSDRLPWRILGLIYAAPHPRSPDTSIIRNKDGQPLPTALSGEPAAEYLISADEMAIRKQNMQKVCTACHARNWVDGHWDRFENTLRTSNEMTKTGTEIISKAWGEKVADRAVLFDEAIEKLWVEQWLFYANSTRFASAMMGADYGVFANGRWYLAKNIQDMLDHLRFLMATKNKSR